jgi:carbon-monoxide dehydrogenase large subunit
MVGRPVQWIESRHEHLLATSHGRGQIADIEVGAGPDGSILALKIDILADLGAYLMRYTSLVPTITLQMVQGPYHIEHVGVTLTGVYTNKVPTGPYRGAGRPEATYYLERAIDLVARELDRDPAAVRERNFIRPGEFPYKSAGGPVYDSGRYGEALRRTLDTADYSALREAQRQRRAGEGLPLGIGLSSYVEVCGFGPMEYGAVRINADATVQVLTGTAPHGQGGATSLAQIVADTLQVPMAAIRVVYGDTAIVPRGHGTGGSRTMAVGGSAVLEAARKVRAQVLRIAAHLLEASPDDMVLEWGSARVAGVSTSALTLEDIAHAVYRDRRVPPDMSPELAASHEFVPPDTTFPFGTHLCVVEVDPQTGAVHLLQYVAVDDCGTVINPMLVAGQVHGGIAQGVAQALFEEIVYDDRGQLLTCSLADYAVPKAAMLPSFQLEHTVTPTPHNPLGVKGVGEAGTIAATAAVTNAVLDALAGFGIRHLDMPLTARKIWNAIQRSRA